MRRGASCSGGSLVPPFRTTTFFGFASGGAPSRAALPGWLASKPWPRRVSGGGDAAGRTVELGADVRTEPRVFEGTACSPDGVGLGGGLCGAGAAAGGGAAVPGAVLLWGGAAGESCGGGAVCPILGCGIPGRSPRAPPKQPSQQRAPSDALRQAHGRSFIPERPGRFSGSDSTAVGRRRATPLGPAPVR